MEPRNYAAEKRAEKVEKLLGVLAAISVRTGVPLRKIHREWREIADYARRGSPECWAAIRTLEGIVHIPERKGLKAGTSLELFIMVLDEEIRQPLREEAPVTSGA